MALLPFFRRDNTGPAWSGDLSPWRDFERLSEFRDIGATGGFPPHFRSHVGGILRHMDDSIARMDEEMRKVMRASTGNNTYDGGSMLSDLHTINPSITQQNGQTIAHYDFDVKGFRPEEITVKTQEKTLEVTARHQERTAAGEVSREFKRTFTIPDGISPDELQGRLVQDGVLRVEAPYRPPAIMSSEPSYIPISHQF